MWLINLNVIFNAKVFNVKCGTNCSFVHQPAALVTSLTASQQTHPTGQRGEQTLTHNVSTVWRMEVNLHHCKTSSIPAHALSSRVESASAPAGLSSHR